MRYIIFRSLTNLTKLSFLEDDKCEVEVLEERPRVDEWLKITSNDRCIKRVFTS
jgi:hypothetical protein